MKTPRIEETVEEYAETHPCISKCCDGGGTLTVQNVDGEPEQEQCEYCYRQRFPDLAWLRTALTEAHQAGIDEAVEIVDDRHTWYNTNNKIPDSELSKGDEHFEMIQNVVKGSLAEVNQRIKDDIKALTDKK